MFAGAVRCHRAQPARTLAAPRRAFAAATAAVDEVLGWTALQGPRPVSDCVFSVRRVAHS